MAGTLKVKIQEDIILDNQDYGSKRILEISSINEISKRILTITTNEAVIATFAGTVGSAGHYNDGNVRYIRFTNLHATYFVTLTFRNQDNDEVAIKLDAGQSFIWNGDNSTGLEDSFNATQDADAASDTAFGSLTNIQADAEASTVQIEMFVASV